MKTQYYKIVKKIHQHYASAIIGTLQYRLNRWTYPPKHRFPFLFVFNSRENAREFRRGLIHPKDYVLFKCDVKNPTGKREGRTSGGKYFEGGYWPCGTRFADAVKLTKQIS